MPIITSLLDNDLYKFTMMQAVLHHFPQVKVEYKFQCRTTNIDFSPIIKKIRLEITHLCSLRFHSDEIEYLRTLPFLKQDYLDFLNLFQFNQLHIKIREQKEKNHTVLDLRISGPWLLTILFETPVLAIINELFFRHNYPHPDFIGAQSRLEEKIDIVRGANQEFQFADFGTRRRFSKGWQEKLIRFLVESDINGKGGFVGTSNVLFARQFSIAPIGTMAHEWLQAGQAMDIRLIDSQKYMLQKWVDEYRGSLGIALSDVLGIEAFLRDFDSYFCKLYDGIRQDSGDPIEVGEKIIHHYNSLNIDPRTKTIVFSDGLNFSRALDILQHFKSRIRVSFGIGTNLTNDFLNHIPIQIVIKMVQCNNQPVAKISDTVNKGMCEDEKYLQYLMKVMQILPSKTTAQK